MCPLRCLTPVALVLALLPAPAYADATVFLGSAVSPAGQTMTGFALGASILVIGVEFEYASARENLPDGAPLLRAGMGNVLLQTPVPVAGLQPYVTTGAGLYRERLGGVQETHVAFNGGGGVKVSLAGPLGARFDYRVFRLRGDPIRDTVHRLYAGFHVRF